MRLNHLRPDLNILQEEYLLIQAWKKTANYIRSFNSYVDTLALDRVAVNLPEFLNEIQSDLKASKTWTNNPLRIIPAPKGHEWNYPTNNKEWEPIEEKFNASKLRPLAYVSLKDQVIATAVMLCLADRIETRQGDPRTSLENQASFKNVISYGNRLFCDSSNSGELHHRWGSIKLYRSYFQDYRTFIARPDMMVNLIQSNADKDFYIIHADIKKFYDCVTPTMLSSALHQIQHSDDDSEFFTFLKSVFSWEWDQNDYQKIVKSYAEYSKIDDFTQVVLPQGLVSSGFFANLILLTFDDELRAEMGKEIFHGVMLHDVCRYVDDLRVLIEVKNHLSIPENKLKCKISNWLGKKLSHRAHGLKLSDDKTVILKHHNKRSQLLPNSIKMNRIQRAVSGGFDAHGGGVIIDAIQDMIYIRNESMIQESDELPMIPDVRHETVNRFASRRFRKTFRSTRPLLPEKPMAPSELGIINLYSQLELDLQAKNYADRLIKIWIKDPSNVLLLRIGLDLWPCAEVLKFVLELLKPHVVDNTHIVKHLIACFCLSEIFHAGATETGIVPDQEQLPSGVSMETYRKVLFEEATRIAQMPDYTIPWYLHQKALLLVATYSPDDAPVMNNQSFPENILRYLEMIQFLRGHKLNMSNTEFATLAVICRRIFKDKKHTLTLIRDKVNIGRLVKIVDKDPSFALELIDTELITGLTNRLSKRIRNDLCLISRNSDQKTLAQWILKPRTLTNSIRNELTFLYFAEDFLTSWDQDKYANRVITPEQIILEYEPHDDQKIKEKQNPKFQIKVGRNYNSAGSIYSIPSWCNKEDVWRLQLGFLLRFILSQHCDFTQTIRSDHPDQSESVYRSIRSHWYQRLYGLFNRQSAFGDNWLPISDWFENFLLGLLAWPGCKVISHNESKTQGIETTRECISARIKYLNDLRGSASGMLILPLHNKPPIKLTEPRTLRACIVQTVFPSSKEFKLDDLTLSSTSTRKKHRNHLAAALASVDHMLRLRNTHTDKLQSLDWLILPELSVHPEDVNAYLLPFARKHKAIILTGLTYEEIIKGEPLVNSALWIIPEYSEAHGLQVYIRRQGKYHLSKHEVAFNRNCKRKVEGFRPCQWLIEYPWLKDQSLWLTGSICYDATDMALMSDLRDRSDVLAIPALNMDVDTFDQMAQSLHYHIYQYVLVINNGTFGGSSGYFPHKDKYKRKVFHTHGQPQAAISFLDIDEIENFVNRRKNLYDIDMRNEYELKYPPAALNYMEI